MIEIFTLILVIIIILFKYRNKDNKIKFDLLEDR